MDATALAPKLRAAVAGLLLFRLAPGGRGPHPGRPPRTGRLHLQQRHRGPNPGSRHGHRGARGPGHPLHLRGPGHQGSQGPVPGAGHGRALGDLRGSPDLHLPPAPGRQVVQRRRSDRRGLRVVHAAHARPADRVGVRLPALVHRGCQGLTPPKCIEKGHEKQGQSIHPPESVAIRALDRYTLEIKLKAPHPLLHRVDGLLSGLPGQPTQHRRGEGTLA